MIGETELPPVSNTWISIGMSRMRDRSVISFGNKPVKIVSVER